MTKQESFKRRIRARMEKTGERYAAARRALLAQAEGRRRTWAAEPEFGDEPVRMATGKDWDQWCDVLDARPDRSENHTAMAAYLRDELGVDPWWSQAITGGYERITGLRLPGQMPDGTFTANKSKTFPGDATLLRALLLDASARDDLFPNQTTALRSNPTAKALRLDIGPGVATFGIEQKTDKKVRVTIQHAKLPNADDVAVWKFYWNDWLEALTGDS